MVATVQGIFKFCFVVACLTTSQLLLVPARTYAGSVDVNGNALPDPSDGKSTVIDNSKGKEAPPIVRNGCTTPPDTEFRIGIPGWMPSLSGDFGVRGLVTDQDVKFSDIFKRLDMIAVGSLYARYHRWEIFADGQYLKLSDTAQLGGILLESARVSLKSAFAESFLSYRLINCEDGFLSVFAGARYNYMQGDLHLRGARLASRRASGSIDWVDPVIGTTGKIHVWKPVSLWAEGDVGGFDANGDSAFVVARNARFGCHCNLRVFLASPFLKFVSIHNPKIQREKMKTKKTFSTCS